MRRERESANAKSQMTKPKRKSIRSQLSKHNCHTDEESNAGGEGGGKGGKLKLSSCGKELQGAVNS